MTSDKRPSRSGGSSSRFDLVACPACGHRRIEMYMRAIIYANDPMACGSCGHHFVAGEISAMWKDDGIEWRFKHRTES